MNTSQFNGCVDRHSDGLYRFVVGILHDTENAKDVVQESFTRLWENRKKIENGKDKSYLFTIAYNLAISHYRSATRHPKIELECYSTASMNYNEDYNNETEILWSELDKLPPIPRTLIMLCDWEGYSYEEISNITQLNQGQVKIGLHRARQTLKERLNAYYDER